MFPVGTVFVPLPPKTGSNLLQPRPPLIVERVVIVGDEALKYPFGRAVQQGSSGSENLAWRGEKNVVQQTVLETGDNEVVKVMTRYSAVH